MCQLKVDNKEYTVKMLTLYILTVDGVNIISSELSWRMPFSSVSYSDMLGLHSLKAAGAVYCSLLYVLSLALAASAQLSPPLLQLNKSTLP